MWLEPPASATALASLHVVINRLRRSDLANRVHRRLSAGRPRQQHVPAPGAARHHLQPGPAVPAGLRGGVRPLSQRVRRRRLQPAVVPGGRDAAVLHPQRESPLGRRDALRPRRDLPPRSVHAHPGGAAAAGKRRKNQEPEVQMLKMLAANSLACCGAPPARPSSLNPAFFYISSTSVCKSPRFAATTSPRARAGAAFGTLA